MEIVTGDGSVLQCSTSENTDVFAAARVGLGALGVVSTITLRCVPAFTLHAVNEPMRLDDVLAVLDEHVDGNDHFEINWFPHTEWVQAKQNNRVDDAPEPRARAKEWFDEVFLENVALKAAWRVGRRFPSTIPGISRQLTKAITRVESTEKSYKVFTTPRLVRFYEMEYGVPRAAVVECVRELRSFIDASGLQIQVPGRGAVRRGRRHPALDGLGPRQRVRGVPRVPRPRATSSTSAVSSGSWRPPAAGRTGASSISRPPRPLRRAIRTGRSSRPCATRSTRNASFTNPYLDRVLG